MERGSRLEAFLRTGPGRKETPALAEALEALHAAGRRAWPDVTVPDEAWARFVAERVQAPDEVALVALDGAGLYLVAAVLAGHAQALVRFNHLLDTAARAVRSPVAPEDLRQALGERLLVPAPGEAPRLAGYRGQGALPSWLRTAAARLAINLRQAHAPGTDATLDSAEALAAMIITPDAELGLLAACYRDKLRAAFVGALSTLEPRERNVLRFHFLQGVTGEALATMYGVTRRTVHRWLEDIRLSVLEKTRARLADAIQVPPDELDGLIEALQSQLASVVHGALQGEPRGD